MAAQVQAFYNDSRRLYDELHQMYPEVAENDLVTLIRDNGCDRAKCLQALVHMSNQLLYGPDRVATTTVVDQLAHLHLPPAPNRIPVSDTTNRGATPSDLTPPSRDQQYYMTQQTHYIQHRPAVSGSPTPQFPPSAGPHMLPPSGQGPRYVTQIDVENSGRGVGQHGYMPPPHLPPTSLQYYGSSPPGTCAIRQPPMSLQIHSDNTPSAAHHNALVQRPGQFSQPFPGGAMAHMGGDHQRQLYTPPPTARAEAYLVDHRQFVQQSPHPSPPSQTPTTPSSSRYYVSKYIHVSPAEPSRPPFYQSPQGPPAVTPTYQNMQWHPSYSQSPPTDLLTSPDPEAARIQQQPLQPVVSSPFREPPKSSLLQMEGKGPWPAAPRSEGPASEAEYTQTLLQYQAQRKHKLEQDMGESRSLLEQLRREVTSMEQDQLERRRRSRNYNFPQAHDVQILRETNRKLQIDIKIMAAQVDMVTNGQTPLGILDPAEEQRFYSNINTGQQGPINQLVPLNPRPVTHHGLLPPGQYHSQPVSY
ncbi:hypothetical protein NP493_14g04000 [Ridgeia piscesae]|uniref:CUE domain-containing protein n=1 Tax=Ridgeia piscesae TaxID=27915 RepID=A0AAD9UKR8_RIDPI|nr:hypothetical protein NP493_14g04000 [Ridgeia piscesae]